MISLGISLGHVKIGGVGSVSPGGELLANLSTGWDDVLNWDDSESWTD